MSFYEELVNEKQDFEWQKDMQDEFIHNQREEIKHFLRKSKKNVFSYGWISEENLKWLISEGFFVKPRNFRRQCIKYLNSTCCNECPIVFDGFDIFRKP